MTDSYSNQLVAYLNQLLSNTAVLTNNMYIYHWNIVGPLFFPLHSKFQEYYEKGTSEYDIIAERIRQLGGYPATLSKYNSLSGIKEAVSKEYNSNEALVNTINDFKYMHRFASDVSAYASSIGDSVTSGIVGDNVAYLEKQIWMLEANVK
ncbi:MAG: DNA starvation/stationary phase protection protein [Bacilli bacterium]|nr:DNA starvation/stationary phase protection protein [Bacilli bacterium]MDD3304709.1 DNA starvation/stationary phase protection protein [Bacilli bacterium]MDD4053612.1 DNA starvation/stationary phase protection protein [Bacilli bacterium]MDD4411111.1 DNA starvation/stationary phase protection protein [Bacilli bacterium]